MAHKRTDEYGTHYWCNDQGKYHREDGPAVECDDGYKEWRINGELHREDGPAIEYPNGDKKWWLNDIEYSEKEYKIKMRTKKLKSIL